MSALAAIAPLRGVPAATIRPPAPPAEERADFAGALRAAAGTAGEPKSDARRAAEQIVSSALVMPILSMVRESTLAEDGPFAPGPAERRFGPMLDQEIADRIVTRARFPIVDRIERQLLRKEDAS